MERRDIERDGGREGREGERHKKGGREGERDIKREGGRDVERKGRREEGT